MSKKQKLIEKLKRRSKNFDYNEAEHLLKSWGLENPTRAKPVAQGLSSHVPILISGYTNRILKKSLACTR